MRSSHWLLAAAMAAALANPAWAQDQPAAPDDPAVAAILETKPSTPGECVRAAKILSDLKRPDLAKQFLQKVLEAKLDQAALAKLADQFGPAAFVQLSVRTDLRPESKQLADAVLGAHNAELQNPQRLAKLIKQLQAPSAEQRRAAFAGLMEAREAGVAELVQVLADPERESEYTAVRTALAAMGRQAVNPLLTILEQADTKLQVQAIAVLGALKAPRLQLFLLQPYFSEKTDPVVRAAAGDALRKLSGALPTKNQAVHVLMENARMYFNLPQPMPGAIEGEVENWQWDEAQRQLTATMISADDAARQLATRLSRDAYQLAPQDTAVKRLYIASLLEAAAYKNGLLKPLDDNDKAVIEAKQLGVKAVEAALDYALAGGHPAAAAAAASILGRIGTAEELLYYASQPPPLTRAMQNSDRRLRMAAARAIMALKPQKPYAGSSYLPDALAFFAASSGVRKVLLAGGNPEDLRTMVSALSAAGLIAETASSGREVLLLAASSPDYELAFIDAGIDRPPIDLLLQQLRHDWRSADLRVGLLAREGFFDRAEHVAEQDPLTKAFARPHDDASVRWQMEQLAALMPQEFVPFEERQQQAAQALEMMAELVKTRAKLYDLGRIQQAALAALNTPALSQKAIAVLAQINSPEAQRALAETAGRDTRSLDIREAAAAAFRQNIQAHGILLTSEEIQQQYQRYNNDKKHDSAAQKILGQILDCLEAPAAASSK
jgi:hypothetical protein